MIQNITPDFAPTAKASEVVARKLACGCVVGGSEYEAFLQSIHEINAQEAIAVAAAKKAAADKRATAYQGLVVAKQGA